MIVIQIINLVLFGFAVGILGTYIGVGGGFLHVPTLLYFYGASPQHAVGTSLVVVFFNALSGTFNYARQKRIDYKTGWRFALATVPGAIIGVYLTRYFNNNVFSMVFGFFLLGIALLTLIRPFLDAVKKKSGHSGKENLKSKNPVREIKDALGNNYTYSFNFKFGLVLSVFIGFLSSLLGVGGGILHVPALIHLFNFPVHIATATSHFILAISALFGSFFHFTAGNVLVMPALAMTLGTILGAQIGARFAARSRPVWITAILSVILFFVGLQMTGYHFSKRAVRMLEAGMNRNGVADKGAASLQRIPNAGSQTPRNAVGAAGVPAIKQSYPAGTAVPPSGPNEVTGTTPGAGAGNTGSISPGGRVGQSANRAIAPAKPHAVTGASPGVHANPTAQSPAQPAVPHSAAGSVKSVNPNAVTAASPKFLPGENLIGADIVNVDETIARQFKLPLAQGVLVNGVEPGSGADLGGLRRGDIIVKFEATRVRDINHMERLIAGEQIGEKINLKVLRNGKPQILFVAIGKKPESIKRKQVALATKAGIHIGYVALVIIVVFYFLLRGWLERVVVVSLGAAVMIWIGTYHGFYNYEQAFKSIFWNTLALLLGMNLISAVFAEAGFFNYVAKKVTLITGGRKNILFVFFCLVTYLLSCFVNNLSAIIIILPILFGLARELEFDPKPYIVGIIVASNFGGASTMVGDFPNMIIGSQIDIPFNKFFVYMLPANLLMLAILMVYISRYEYAHKNQGGATGKAKPSANAMTQKIRVDNLLGEIKKQMGTVLKNPTAASRAGIILFIVFVLFLLSDSLHVPPSVIALAGGGTAVIWSGIGVNSVLRRIQISDLIFFIAMFILVGGVQAIGLLDMASEKMLKTAEGNVLVLNLLLMWTAGIATCFLNAGPTTVLFIPIIRNFSMACPHYLFWWSLSLGVCAGSSGTLTGATAGPVSATMYDKFLNRESKRMRFLTGKRSRVKEQRLTFMNYAKIGIPMMLFYLIIASVYVVWLYKF